MRHFIFICHCFVFLQVSWLVFVWVMILSECILTVRNAMSQNFGVGIFADYKNVIQEYRLFRDFVYLWLGVRCGTRLGRLVDEMFR